MPTSIIYQGYAEQFRVREIDDAGEVTRQDPEFYGSQEEAIEAAKAHAPKNKLDIRPIANFNETIEEAEAREAAEQEDDR